MRITEKEIEERENTFYYQFLSECQKHASATVGVNVDVQKFKTLVSAASVVAKQRQTRTATKMVEHQISKDVGKTQYLVEAKIEPVQEGERYD